MNAISASARLSFFLLYTIRIALYTVCIFGRLLPFVVNKDYNFTPQSVDVRSSSAYRYPRRREVGRSEASITLCVYVCVSAL